MIDEASDRIIEWEVMGNDEERLDLSNLKLTELPELPNGIKYLDCSNNYLTSLSDTLPISLVYLNCNNNRLTSLPVTLPSRLWFLDCSNNRLRSLPKSLPAHLEDLKCDHNRLIYLPAKLPSRLQVLDCSYNDELSVFSKKLPDGLTYLNCSYNYSLHSIPIPFPEDLWRFYYYDSNLDVEEELLEEEFEENDEPCGGYGDNYIMWEYFPSRPARNSKKRIRRRCAAIKEALMARAWHPDRLASLIERFGSVPQWNHEFREYGTFDFTAVDEVL